MHAPSPAAATHPPVATIELARPLTLGDRWAASASEPLERTRLTEQARHTDAAAQLRRCCPSEARVLEHLSVSATSDGQLTRWTA